MSAPIPITLPQAVRLRYAIPDVPLILVGGWWMDGGERRGLWVARANEPAVGQRWPVTGVTVDELREWTGRS